MFVRSLSWVTLFILLATSISAAEPEKTNPAKPQYVHEDVHIGPASADEPIRAEFSAAAALDYVTDGAVAWGKANSCVSCHTNGSYLRMRPALTPLLGAPSGEVRELFLAEMDKLVKLKEKHLKKNIRPTITAYLAAGLAEWDRHVAGQLSPETDAALRLMFAAQADDGSWSNEDCWPPIESSAYHAATVAAMATATAPGWLEQVSAATDDTDSEAVREGIARMKSFLRDTEPPHDYGRLLLLWTSTRMDGLLADEAAAETRAMIFSHQNDDGGWSLRSFATPETWGSGNRAERLKAEDDATRTASDGHMTGLAVIVLRAAGVSDDDERIERAVTWLKSNQRESGRWWTRSLSSDRYHYITYTGSMYPLAALAACGELSPPGVAGNSIEARR
ncbi:MAG: hypothetical protein DWQ31_04630 [Planctomycetota bacterium]|nr:MAG: hypothetical protein DWQ31_04630 [Planctomycetota bacterium]